MIRLRRAGCDMDFPKVSLLHNSNCDRMHHQGVAGDLMCVHGAMPDRRLTEAAIELLVKSGIQDTALQAVGERTRYGRAVATHRFGSKAGLSGVSSWKSL